MRTEDQLRSILVERADRPYATDELYASILRQARRRPARRRRTALVLAVAVVVVALAVALPTFLTRRTVAPADQRVRGNWNLIHTVDVPAGWEIQDQIVTAASEHTTVGKIGEAGGCSIEVYGRGLGDPAASAAKRTAVDVNGHQGQYTKPGAITMGGVVWRYAEDAWAQVSCDRGLQPDLDMARRVRFAVTTTRLPFRLDAVPAGYQVQSVAPPLVSSQSTVLGAVQFTGTDKNHPVPDLSIVMSAGPTEIPEHLPGWETDTVDGIPAVLSARDAQLCLNLTANSVCVRSEGGEPADLTKSLWPAGRRELLVDVAEHLTIAKNLGDQSTWYAANEALPQ